MPDVRDLNVKYTFDRLKWFPILLMMVIGTSHVTCWGNCCEIGIDRYVSQ